MKEQNGESEISEAHIRGKKFAMALFAAIGVLAMFAIVSILMSRPDAEHIVGCAFIALGTIAFVWFGLKDTWKATSTPQESSED